jgi:hypothetical protein
MNHEEVETSIEAAIRGMAYEDLSVSDEPGPILLTDNAGKRWKVLVAEVFPEPDHRPEDCPKKIDMPERVLPAKTYHGCQGEG